MGDHLFGLAADLHREMKVYWATQNFHHYETFTFTFSHLADAFVQSDVQGREYSSYEQ